MKVDFCLVLLFLLASQESKGFDLEYEDIKSSEEDFDDGEVPNDLSKFNSTNKVYQRSNDRQDNPMVIECGDKVKANQFVDTNEFEPLWFASTNYPDNYPKKQKCKFNVAIPSGKKMYIFIPAIDIFTSDPSKCDKKGDFLSIKAPGKKYTICGQGQGLFLEIGPYSKPKKVKFLFKTNNDNNSGSGMVMALHANLLGTWLGLCGKPDYFGASKRTNEFQASPEQLQRLQKAKKMDEIVGGQPADKYEYPWQAALLTEGGGFCGGTLVADQWIVTAFHCIDENGMTAFLHAHDLSDATGAIAVGVSEIKLLPNSGVPIYDIALLKLQNAVSFSDELYPACLVGPDFEYQGGNDVVTSGWGSMTGLNGTISIILQELETELVDQSVCADFAGGPSQYNEELIICAGLPGTGVCPGDSGGPLIESVYDHAHLIGVTSFVTGECGTTPSYFAKAQPAAGWIQQNVFEN